MRFTGIIAATSMVVALNGAAVAEDIALVITQVERPGAAISSNARNRAHQTLVNRLVETGYIVFEATDPDRAALAELIEQTEAAMTQETGKLLIQYTGPTVSLGSRTALIPSEARVATPVQADTRTVPLSALLDLAAERPAENLVGLGIEDLTPSDVRDFANPQPIFEIPQGVTVLRGRSREVIDIVSDQIIDQGRRLGALSIDAEDARFEGLVLDGLRFDREGQPRQPRRSSDTQVAEEALWLFAGNGNNPAALRIYLQRYPNGRYADEARRRLGLPDPNAAPTPEEIEQDLALSRNARRAIQQNLTELGFSTRGVDGIFGSGTRSAIRGWQKSARLEETGYLDTDQIEQLSRQAEIRAEARKAEEERIARERRAADEAYWRRTGQSGKEEDLREYLRQYPEGIFADQAQRDLDRLAEETRRLAERREREDFRAAERENTARAYRQFLRKHPDGRFRDEARERIANLRRDRPSDEEIARFRDRERALNLTSGTVVILEQRLRVVGQDPGAIDGKIDRQTRRAIARFQNQQNLTATGYLDPVTIQRLILASSG